MIPLQLLTSYAPSHRKNVIRAVQEAVSYGVPYIQFCWQGTDLEIFTLAEQIKRITELAGSKLIVNNRLDVALAVEANGIHIGQTDIPIHLVKKIIPDYMTIGLTISTVQDLAIAEQFSVDYYGIGPIFNTKTKPGETIGLERLKLLRALTTRPIVAIGGIKLDTAEAAFKAGANGIAVIGAIYDSNDKQQTISDLLKISNM
jgi:thiamine-phosphate pyrophosphorylase